jgi:hypothetical protein
MSRYTVTMATEADRARAMQIVRAAPLGARVEIKAAKRSVDQNSRMWAMLTDIATQLSWHGQRLRPDDWKLVFLDALKREVRAVPNIEGNGFVNLGRSSSDLGKQEMSDLMEIMNAFGAKHGVLFADDVVPA